MFRTKEALQPHDLKGMVEQQIKANGGWVVTHAHIDRANTITPETLPIADRTLQEKWYLVDSIKEESVAHPDKLFRRMCEVTEMMISQGASVLASFIDVDPVIGMVAMDQADRVRERYKRDILMLFANQAIKGVIDPGAHEWFIEGSRRADIVGGLPGKDKTQKEKHLDIVLDAANEQGKMAHIHVDQFNDPEERETQMLVKKTNDHGMQGRVVAVHGVSIAAKTEAERTQLYGAMYDAGVGLITCPTAWIDSKRNETPAVTHNSIAPVEELVRAGIPVGIGPDNIADIMKPFTDGDMWTELRFLLESCHYYDVDALVRIATSDGRLVLGLPAQRQ